MERYDDEAYVRAKQKVDTIRSFYVNLIFYCIINTVFIYINVIYSPEFYWFWFPLIGWGIGLAIHGMSAFIKSPIFDKEWEERKIRQLMDKEKNK